jgi:hypothetical protein
MQYEDFTGCLERLAYLLRLEAGWYDGTGDPPHPEAVQDVMRVLGHLLRESLPMPALFPTVEGGLQMEWTVGPWEISIDLMVGHRCYVHAWNKETDADIESDEWVRLWPLLRGEG